jgi:hypothetical protein
VVKEFAALGTACSCSRTRTLPASRSCWLYPKVRWFGPTGLGEPFEAVARVVDRNPALMSELSLKPEVASNGKLDPRWKDLFLRHPDRFMVGTDTWVTSQWDRFAQVQAGLRAWLASSPENRNSPTGMPRSSSAFLSS